MQNQQMWHPLAPLIFLAAAQGFGACGRAPLGGGRSGGSGGGSSATFLAGGAVCLDSACGGRSQDSGWVGAGGIGTSSLAASPAGGSQSDGGGGAGGVTTSSLATAPTGGSQSDGGGGAGGVTTSSLATAPTGGSQSGGGGSTGAGPGIVPEGAGICAITCTKDCTDALECDQSKGELCCDLGTAGRTCLPSAECPKQCTIASECETLTCKPLTLADPQTYCLDPDQGVTICSTDSYCPHGVCCSIYNQPICLPHSQCPRACSTSADCDPIAGDECCTSVRSVEPNLSVSGLCLNPRYQSCPQACATDKDCTSSSAAVCCSGLCAPNCAQACAGDGDCTDQTCCKSALVRLSSQPPKVFTASPTCAGTAFSCSSCASYGCACPGCTSPDPTACLGTAYACGECGVHSDCRVCPGCTWPGSGSYVGFPGSGSCVGSAASCDSLGNTDDLTLCYGHWGCSVNHTSQPSWTCSGTAQACSTFTSELRCEGQSGCSWSTCSGTPTACSQLPPTTCRNNPGCRLSPVTSCTGAATPCIELSGAECLSNPGCHVEK